MLRKFGVDLTSLINSDPAWKVSKGSRSASRRARKPFCRNLKNSAEIIGKKTEVSDMPVSESEKHGVSVLGCRFTEKAEHVPIKKRRFLFRSPSPPPPESLSLPDAVASTKPSVVELQPPSSDISLSQITDNGSGVVTIKPEKTGDSHHNEIFCGMSILAAAACSSSLGKYADNSVSVGAEESSFGGRAPEVLASTGSCFASRILPKEEFVNSSEMSTGGTSSCISSSSQKGATPKMGDMCGSLGPKFTSSGDISCSTQEIQKKLVKDHRLHWDLNVSVEEWDHPSEDLHVVQLSHNISHDAGNTDNNDIAKVQDSQDKHGTECADQEHLLTGGKRMLNAQCMGSLGQKSLLRSCNEKPVAVKSVVDDNKKLGLPQAVNPTGGRGDRTHAIQTSDTDTCSKVSEGSVECTNLSIDADPLGRKGLNSSNNLSSDKLKSSEEMQTTPVCSSSDDPRPVTSNLPVSFDLVKSETVNYDANAATENGRCERGGTLEFTHLTSDRNSIPHSFSHVEGASSRSTRSDLLEGVGVSEDTKKSPSEISQVIFKEEQDSSHHDTCKTTLSKISSSSENIDSAKNFNHNDEADAYGRPHSALKTDAASGHLEGYDSQYEDGELREPNEVAWEGYEVLDREVEHVDYGSDEMEMCTPSPTEEGKNGPMGVAAVVSSAAGHVDDEVSEKATNLNGEEGTRDGNMNIELKYSAEEKMIAHGSKDLLASEKGSSDIANGLREDPEAIETGAESKVLRGGLQSKIEGPITQNALSHEDRLNRMENRYEESSSMRSFGRGRYSFHHRGRGRQGDNWDRSIDNRRVFKRHYSPIQHRQSKMHDDATVERDDTGYTGPRDNDSYSPQFLRRSRSGADEDACTGFQPRYRPDRKFSPDRPATFGRGRFIRHGPFIDNRAGRGRYTGPSPDESFQSSLKFRRPLSRRDRSLSPFGGRGNSNAQPYRGKSPSRSRSRSPVMWNSSRGRPGSGTGGNTFVRQRSRSPTFRSEARPQRLRSPHQQPGFGSDHSVGFRSIPRSQGSPPRGRWNSARKGDLGNFRDFSYKQRATCLERSPGRMRLRGDRDGIVDSPRNMKTDGTYRLSDRISEDGNSRGLRYEENYEDRRKNYGLRPARRSYEDGMSGRLHQDMDNNFSMGNSLRDRDASSFQNRGFRGVDSRVGDIPRRSGGDQQSFMYERDGKFNSESKVDMMDLPNNVKSEEQYRPTHSGRFPDVDGANRGRRFENYEDHRKQFGPTTNFMRRSDVEGSETRLNHNVDENFQDNPDLHGRGGMRNLDGRIGGLSMRSIADQNPMVCEQERKLDENPQSVGMQSSDDNDAAKRELPV